MKQPRCAERRASASELCDCVCERHEASCVVLSRCAWTSPEIRIPRMDRVRKMGRLWRSTPVKVPKWFRLDGVVPASVFPISTNSPRGWSRGMCPAFRSRGRFLELGSHSTGIPMGRRYPLVRSSVWQDIKQRLLSENPLTLKRIASRNPLRPTRLESPNV